MQEGVAFYVQVAADVYGKKENLVFEFPSRPSMAVLAECIQRAYQAEVTNRRPEHFPEVPFRVQSVQLYSTHLRNWVDLASDEQLTNGCQIFAFQPKNSWHSDVQDLIPVAKLPMVSMRELLSNVQPPAAISASPPSTAAGADDGDLFKIEAVFRRLDSQGAGWIDLAAVKRGFLEIDIDFSTATIASLFGRAPPPPGCYEPDVRRVSMEEWVRFGREHPNIIDAFHARGTRRGDTGNVEKVEPTPAPVEDPLKSQREAAAKAQQLAAARLSRGKPARVTESELRPKRDPQKKSPWCPAGRLSASSHRTTPGKKFSARKGTSRSASTPPARAPALTHHTETEWQGGQQGPPPASRSPPRHVTMLEMGDGGRRTPSPPRTKGTVCVRESPTHDTPKWAQDRSLSNASPLPPSPSNSFVVASSSTPAARAPSPAGNALCVSPARATTHSAPSPASHPDLPREAPLLAVYDPLVDPDPSYGRMSPLDGHPPQLSRYHSLPSDITPRHPSPPAEAYARIHSPPPNPPSPHSPRSPRSARSPRGGSPTYRTSRSPHRPDTSPSHHCTSPPRRQTSPPRRHTSPPRLHTSPPRLHTSPPRLHTSPSQYLDNNHSPSLGRSHPDRQSYSAAPHSPQLHPPTRTAHHNQRSLPRDMPHDTHPVDRYPLHEHRVTPPEPPVGRRSAERPQHPLHVEKRASSPPPYPTPSVTAVHPPRTPPVVQATSRPYRSPCAAESRFDAPRCPSPLDLRRPDRGDIPAPEEPGLRPRILSPGGASLPQPRRPSQGVAAPAPLPDRTADVRGASTGIHRHWKAPPPPPLPTDLSPPSTWTKPPVEQRPIPFPPAHPSVLTRWNPNLVSPAV